MCEDRRVGLVEFGRDHWSLLGYVECRVVDYKGILDKRHLRCNVGRHPLHFVNGNIGGVLWEWNPEHGSRLWGYYPGYDVRFQLGWHDDWDCLDDLEASGLIEVLSEANGFVRLTEAGQVVVAALRVHKGVGESFSTFNWCGSAVAEPGQ